MLSNRSLEELGVVRLRTRMRNIVRGIRGSVPLTPLDQPAGIFFVPSVWSGRPNIVPTIWIATGGCRWMPGIGCTMCNYGMSARTYTVAETLSAFDTVLGSLPATPLIHVSPAGSFFDEGEVPQELRDEILMRLSRRRGLQAVGVESRPEFICEDILLHAQHVLASGGKSVGLTIGIGLECADELAREVCINKGTRPDTVEDSIRIIKATSTARSPLGVEVHVLLKPPLLSELEAIDDAVRAIEWAAARNVDKVIFMLNSVKEHTLCEWLFNQKQLSEPLRYVPPRLWSAVEVLLRLKEATRKNVLTFGFVNNIHIQRTASNCERCTYLVQGELTAFNHTADVSFLRAAEQIACQCRSDWKALLAMPVTPLPERIEGDLSEIEQRLSGERTVFSRPNLA